MPQNVSSRSGGSSQKRNIFFCLSLNKRTMFPQDSTNKWSQKSIKPWNKLRHSQRCDITVTSHSRGVSGVCAYLSWSCCWSVSPGVSPAVCRLASSPAAAAASSPSAAHTQIYFYFLIIIFHARLILNYSTKYILSSHLHSNSVHHCVCVSLLTAALPFFSKILCPSTVSFISYREKQIYFTTIKSCFALKLKLLFEKDQSEFAKFSSQFYKLNLFQYKTYCLYSIFHFTSLHNCTNVQDKLF